MAQKLEPITFREDDALTLNNTQSTTLGRPNWYEIFNFNYYLRPVPDTGYTVNLWTFNEPAPVMSGTQVLELPSCFHMDLVDFVTMKMALKDREGGIEIAKAMSDRWKEAKVRMKRWTQKKKRGDAFTVVQNEESLAVTLTGPV